MSAVGEERYVDLKKICDQVEPELFDSLSWILLLNLDLIPEDDVKINPNIKFSYSLMQQEYEEAMKLANSLASGTTTLAQQYKNLLEKDPKLAKTKEVSELFFALAKRRIELMERLGIHQD